MWWWGMYGNMAGMHISWVWGMLIFWIIMARASRHGRRYQSHRHQRGYAPQPPLAPFVPPAPKPAPTREEQLAALGERYARGEIDRADYETRRAHLMDEALAESPKEADWPNLS